METPEEIRERATQELMAVKNGTDDDTIKKATDNLIDFIEKAGVPKERISLLKSYGAIN